MQEQDKIYSVLNQFFSKELIERANKVSSKYFKKLYKSMFVLETSKKYVYFSEFYDRLKTANGIRNPYIDYEIHSCILKSPKSKELIKSVIISFLLNRGEFVIPKEYFQNDTKTLLEFDLRELEKLNFTRFPTYIGDALISMIYMFAVEFDDDMGRVPKEDYNGKRDLYINLKEYGEWQKLATSIR